MMRVELFYDPVRPETAVRLNGQWLDGSDIYGLLYQVGTYPIQAWLFPDGSWPGFASQLRDLARGEEIELTFRGRAADLADVRDALRATERLTLIHRAHDPLAAALERVRALEAESAQIDRADPSVALDAGPPPTAEGEDWLATIRDEGELRAFARDPGCCCAVADGFFTSYDRLGLLAQLTQSMKIPADAVCCLFSTAEKRDAFAAYARMFPRMRYRFAAEGDAGWIEELEAKYGAPWRARGRLAAQEKIAREIRRAFDRRDALEEQRRALIAKAREEPLGEADGEVDLFERLRAQLLWMDKNQGRLEAMERLLRLSPFEETAQNGGT